MVKRKKEISEKDLNKGKRLGQGKNKGSLEKISITGVSFMFGENHFPLRRALLKFIDMAIGRMVSWGKIWVISKIWVIPRRVGHYRRVQGVEGSREML